MAASSACIMYLHRHLPTSREDEGEREVINGDCLRIPGMRRPVAGPDKLTEGNPPGGAIPGYLWLTVAVLQLDICIWTVYC